MENLENGVCTFPGCCHGHSGSQRQWLNIILSGSGTSVMHDSQKETSKRSRKKSLSRTHRYIRADSTAPRTPKISSVNSSSQLPPVQSGMPRLPGQCLSPPGMYPQMTPAICVTQPSPLQRVHVQQQLMQHIVAANRLPGPTVAALYPDPPAYMPPGTGPGQAIPTADSPFGMLQSRNRREIVAGGDLSLPWIDPKRSSRKSLPRTHPHIRADSTAPQTPKTSSLNSSSQQPSPVKSGMPRLPCQYLVSPPGMYPQMTLAIYVTQPSPLQSGHFQQQLMQHNVAANRLPGPTVAALYPDLPAYMPPGVVSGQAIPTVASPFGMFQSRNLGKEREVWASQAIPMMAPPCRMLQSRKGREVVDDDLSVFRLTPGHNRRGAAGEDGKSSHRPSSVGQQPRSWHTPHSATSTPYSVQNRSTRHQTQVIGFGAVQNSVGKERTFDHSLQEDCCALDFSSPQPQPAETQECSVSQQQEQQQNQRKENLEPLPGSSRAGKVDDVVITRADKVVLIVGGAERRGESQDKASLSEQLPASCASNKQLALPLSTVAGTEEVPDSDDDDCIVLDLSMALPPTEDSSKHQEGHMDTDESGHPLSEQDSQGGRGRSLQLTKESSLSTGQNCGPLKRSTTKTEEPSEIKVLGTVPLSEQQSTDSHESAIMAKTYHHQLSAESSYRCGSGCFPTVLPIHGNTASIPSPTARDVPHLSRSSDSSSVIAFIPGTEASLGIAPKMEVTFSTSCVDLSLSVPFMTPEQYNELTALEVNDSMEFRCKFCTSDFKWRYKFYEHLCYHYHYRCFKCAHCPFLAFCGSSVVSHSRTTHHDQKPGVVHCPKPNCETRIERAIREAYISVTDPYTERRLLAYQRAKLKKRGALRKKARGENSAHFLRNEQVKQAGNCRDSQ